MLKINFYPANNDVDVLLATEVYRKIWSGNGERIVSTIEKITGLKFKEEEINAKISDSGDRSEPLEFFSKHKSTGKRAILIHELTHRILSTNDIDTNKVGENKLESHKILDLILYDVWVEIFDNEFADFALSLEKKWPNPIYKKAWDWALSMTKEERAKEFKNLVEKSKSIY